MALARVYGAYDRKALQPRTDALDDLFTGQPVSDTLQYIADKIREWATALTRYGHQHPQLDDMAFSSPFMGAIASWLDARARDPVSCASLAKLTNEDSSK